jgi:hypothetical protein
MIAVLQMISDADGAFLLANPSSVESVFYAKTDAVLDLDKIWHGIHFFMTGDSLTPVEGDLKPLGFLMYYGASLGDEDSVYRFLSSKEVANIALALVPMTRETLEKRYSVADLVAAEIQFFDVIHSIGADGSDSELLDLYSQTLSSFEKLKSFMFKAKQDGKALLVSVS